MRVLRPSIPTLLLTLTVAACSPKASSEGPCARSALKRGGLVDITRREGQTSSDKPHAVHPLLASYSKTGRGRFGRPRAMHLGRGSVLFLRGDAENPAQSLVEVDTKTGEERVLVDASGESPKARELTKEERARLERARESGRGVTFFEPNHDGSLVLFSQGGKAKLYDMKARSVRALGTGDGAVIDPHWLGRSNAVGFVRDGELWTVTVGATGPRRITRPGGAGKTHGLAEFIAQEELGRSRGFFSSPDGRQILFEEVDESGVETLHIADPSDPAKAPITYAYPRPGKPNAKTRFGLISSQGGTARWITLSKEPFEYVATITWSAHGPPTALLLDRLQRHARLVSINVRTLETTELLSDSDDAWVNVEPSVPAWLSPEAGFLWAHENDSGTNLEWHTPDGQLKKVIDLGGASLRSIVATSDDGTSARVVVGTSPIDHAVVDIGFDFDAGTTKIVPRIEPVRGEIEVADGFSPNGVAIGTTSSSALPTYAFVDTSGRRIPIASHNRVSGDLPKVEFRELGPDKVWVAIVRPRDARPGERLPLIDSAYGGPGVTVARVDASHFILEQALADDAHAIVVRFDGRGTPRRGRAWERALAGKLGSVPLDEHVRIVGEIAHALPEVDSTRIGIFGWSFGGYLSALAAVRRPDVFKVAVAGAPPADWRDYDTAYTERYLGLPDEQAGAYDAASLLDGLDPRGERRRDTNPAPLLILHGTADDNVYFFHSVKLSETLARKNAPFELRVLAGATHIMRDPEQVQATWVKAFNFVRAHLKAR